MMKTLSAHKVLEEAVEEELEVELEEVALQEVVKLQLKIVKQLQLLHPKVEEEEVRSKIRLWKKLTMTKKNCPHNLYPVRKEKSLLLLRFNRKMLKEERREKQAMKNQMISLLMMMRNLKNLQEVKELQASNLVKKIKRVLRKRKMNLKMKVWIL
jgi:hypothetical protein